MAMVFLVLILWLVSSSLGRQSPTWNSTGIESFSNYKGVKSFGKSIAMSTDYAIIGGEGKAYIFALDKSKNVWNQTAVAEVYPNYGDTSEHFRFGSSTTIARNWAAVGSIYLTTTKTNGVLVIPRNISTDTWNVSAAIILGPVPVPDDVDKSFGTIINLSDDFLIVSGGNWNKEKVYVFKRNSNTNTWGDVPEMWLCPTTSDSYRFGMANAITDKYAIVTKSCSDKNEPGSRCNFFEYVFSPNGQTWGSPTTYQAPQPTMEYFGLAVAMTNKRVVIASPDTIYLYERNPSDNKLVLKANIQAPEDATNLWCLKVQLTDYYVLALDGGQSSSPNNAFVFAFNPDTQSWSETPTLTVIGNGGYGVGFGGGMTRSVGLTNTFVMYSSQTCTGGTCEYHTYIFENQCDPGYIKEETGNKDSTCVACSAGKYQAGVRCQSCPAGRFSSSLAAADISFCRPCITGKYQ